MAELEADNVPQKKITHAVVKFVRNKNDRETIITIDNIKQMRKEQPQEKFDFISNHIYHGKREKEMPYEPIQIYNLGSEAELKQVLEDESASGLRKYRLAKFNNSDVNAEISADNDDLGLSSEKNSDSEQDDDQKDDSDSSKIEKPAKKLNKKKGRKMLNEKVIESNKDSERNFLASKMKALQNANTLDIPGCSFHGPKENYKLLTMDKENEKFQHLAKIAEVEKETLSSMKKKRQESFRKRLFSDDGSDDNSPVEDIEFKLMSSSKALISTKSSSTSSSNPHQSRSSRSGGISSLSPKKAKYVAKKQRISPFQTWIKIVDDKEIEMV